MKKLLITVGVLLMTYYVSQNWYQLMLVQGESMSPTYHNFQLVLLDRYHADYTYGDVVAFRCEGMDAVLVKRIVACPGDTVAIRNGRLYVNGTVSSVFPESNSFEFAGIVDGELQLNNTSYFMIGDNIVASKDSRYGEVGPIAQSAILGEVVR